MCWLIGSMSFSTATQKQSAIIQDDARRILEALIDTELALEISGDPKGGSPLFWSNLWIKHLVKRSNPSLPSPLTVLLTRCGKAKKAIEITARNCDANIYSRQQTSGQETHQQYQQAVKRIHQRLSNVLTSRFHGSRVSMVYDA